jgi:hypothetical protein
MKRKSASAVTAALIAASLALPGQASATYPGANGKIAFTSSRNGSSEIWTMNPDGSGQSPLVSGQDPAWSSDGARLAYVCFSPGGICTANGDGSSVTHLGGGDSNPTWSPDGGRIMFEANPSCGSGCQSPSQLWRMNADGSDQIFFREGGDPDWSADGQRIAYTTSGVPKIDTIKPNNTFAGELYSSGPGRNFDPNWSPDNKIAFVSDRDGNWEIYSMDLNGANQTRLTNDPATDLNPEWSPNSDKIAFTSYRDGNAEIYTMNADGSAPTRLTNDPGYDSYPDWQPIRAAVPRPKGATPVLVTLVAAFEPCSAPNAQHGPPLASGSCEPPAQSGLSATIGRQARGQVRLDVPSEDPANGVDDADVKVSVSLTDVRRASDLADLTRDLDLPLPVRITDNDSGGARVTPATVRDFNYFDNPFHFTVPCAETADTTIGSTCSLQSSVDALTPPSPGGQFLQEGKRSIWQLDRIALYDGGEDGYVTTLDDNTAFAVQGLFVP